MDSFVLATISSSLGGDVVYYILCFILFFLRHELCNLFYIDKCIFYKIYV